MRVLICGLENKKAYDVLSYLLSKSKVVVDLNLSEIAKHFYITEEEANDLIDLLIKKKYLEYSLFTYLVYTNKTKSLSFYDVDDALIRKYGAMEALLLQEFFKHLDSSFKSKLNLSQLQNKYTKELGSDSVYFFLKNLVKTGLNIYFKDKTLILYFSYENYKRHIALGVSKKVFLNM